MQLVQLRNCHGQIQAVIIEGGFLTRWGERSALGRGDTVPIDSPIEDLQIHELDRLAKNQDDLCLTLFLSARAGIRSYRRLYRLECPCPIPP